MSIADILTRLISTPRQHNQSFLASVEQKFIRRIMDSLPEQITPLQLTYTGVVGAGLTIVGLIGCDWTFAWLPVIPAGLALNWFGTSLDGRLALLRNERRSSLAMLDHISDLFSQIAIILAFGMSPFLSLISASIVLICYLLFSSYTYMRAAARHVEQMAYLGLGATEFRILMAVWPLIAFALGIDERNANGVTRLDAATILLATLAIGGLSIKIFGDARKVASTDDKQDL
jgi:phosphatidylglycerophosphate synthase